MAFGPLAKLLIGMMVAFAIFVPLTQLFSLTNSGYVSSSTAHMTNLTDEAKFRNLTDSMKDTFNAEPTQQVTYNDNMGVLMLISGSNALKMLSGSVGIFTGMISSLGQLDMLVGAADWLTLYAAPIFAIFIFIGLLTAAVKWMW